MVANPITWTEIEAFARLNRISLSAWEAGLYRRLDDAVLAAWRGDGPSGKPPENEPIVIPVADTKRLKEMLRGTAARTQMIEQHKAQARASRKPTT